MPHPVQIAKTLPNGIQILVEDNFIWKAYNYRCVLHPRQYAVTLHEEPPKSQNPYWKDYPTQRFPLCAKCHDKVHEMSRRDATYLLYEARIRNFHNAVKEIDECVAKQN
jgi:hypothetical protein